MNATQAKQISNSEPVITQLREDIDGEINNAAQLGYFTVVCYHPIHQQIIQALEEDGFKVITENTDDEVNERYIISWRE